MDLAPCHEQTWVKVNARVDTGIAELVRALSRFPKLETIESCQGAGEADARVLFWYGPYWADPWRGICEFTFGFLMPGLRGLVGQHVAKTPLSLHPAGFVEGSFNVHPGSIEKVTVALNALADGLPGPPHSGGNQST